MQNGPRLVLASAVTGLGVTAVLSGAASPMLIGVGVVLGILIVTGPAPLVAPPAGRAVTDGEAG